MSEPVSGTSAIAAALTGVSLYGLFSENDYGVLFGAFAGATFYIASVIELSNFRRLAYFVVSYIAGVLCSGLIGAKLNELTGYRDKPLDALGAVLVSALAIKILTMLNNDFTILINRVRGDDSQSKK
jgi:FtsH-binding integral membrane protein